MADPFLEECHTGNLTQRLFYAKITWSCVLLVLVNTLIYLLKLYWFEDKNSQFSPSVLSDCFWPRFFAILSWRQDRHGIILSLTHLFSNKFWQPFPFTWNVSPKDLENASSYSLSNVVLLETLNKIFSLHLTRKLLLQISALISTKFLAGTGHVQYILGKGNKIIMCFF